MKLFFDRDPVTHFDELIRGYAPNEFASPTRSTVSLLSLLKHGGAVWSGIAGALVGGSSAVEAHVEYTVRPPQGSGKPSHTDVMLIAAGHACALEAKWTEPRYETVGEWLNRGTNPDNRRAVLDGWISSLRSRIRKSLDRGEFSDAVYQMVHRAASACEAGRSSAMAYLQFMPLPGGALPVTSALECDLAHLHRVLGNPTPLPFYWVEVEVRPTAAFERIKELPKGSRDTEVAVRTALGEAPLFDFGSFRVRQIGPGSGD